MLQLADGRSLKADLVIAADGVRSSVRDSLGLVGERRKYQDGIIRVLLERTDLVGGHWNHVIDFWAFTPRRDAAHPLRPVRERHSAISA